MPSENLVRHNEYYIEGADTVICVENTLFRVHRYFLIRDSAYFRDKLPQPFSPGESSKGSSDRNPLVLDNVLKVEFERLLWVFYNPKYSLYDAGIEEWTSILKLAHDWNFIEVKALAVRELQSLQIPALQKIVLYQTYAIDRNLLQPAYTALITRDEPITTEEGRELTIETALSLARAREIARAPAFSGSGKKPGNPRSPVNLAGVDLDALIKETFQLSSNDAAAERPPTQPTSTGRGTPSSGRDSPHPGTQTTGTGYVAQGTGGAVNGIPNGQGNASNGHSLPNGTSGTHINGAQRGQPIGRGTYR